MTVAARDLDAAIVSASARIDARAILDELDPLMAVPAPPGRERALAEHAARTGAERRDGLEWTVDPIDDRSANLVVRAVRGTAARTLGLYAHLDTSLTGESQHDALITGESAAPAPHGLDRATGDLRGFGVGIARAPAAAAIAVLREAAGLLQAAEVPHRIELLLAAGGTHRSLPGDGPTRFGRGVSHALARGWRPDAVLNVKGGPPGVLREEPATAYLRVRLRSRWTAALVRAKVAPDGGLVRHAGVVLDAIEDWRTSFLAAHPPAGQLGCEVAIGAVRGGSPEKADLIPGVLEVSLYAVLPPDADPDAVARDLAGFLRPRLRDLPAAPALSVDAYAFAPGGSTDAAAEIVRLARAAWRTHRRSDPDAIAGWTGATDGGVLMAAGIPTARCGAYVRRDGVDARVEIVAMDELVASARAWTETVIRYCAGDAAAGTR